MCPQQLLHPGKDVSVPRGSKVDNYCVFFWVSLAFLLRRKGIIFLMPTVLRHYHCVSSPPSSVLHVADLVVT